MSIPEQKAEVPLCIYHHGCSDGFAAAWVIRKHYGAGGVDFHPGIYGEAPPDVRGRVVILVDFSYKRETLLEIAREAASVLVIDHHQSARDDLEGLAALAGNVVTVFDMERSGAMLTWDFFFSGKCAPLLLDYVQDRDLWRFKLPSTREVTAALFSHPFSFDLWDSLMYNCLPLIDEGRAILRKHNSDVAAIIRDARRWLQFDDIRVPAANVPWMMASDVGGELAKGHPFAVTYYDDENGRRFSLRSAPDGADVAKIAEGFSGGGHRHAAGFRLSHEDSRFFEVMGRAPCGKVA